MADPLHFDPTRTEWVVREGPVRCIRLQDRLTGASTYVTATPGGVFINGDATIDGSHGCGTFDAKTLEWLARARGSYLHHRFIEERWDPEHFVRSVADILADEDAEDYGLKLDDLREIVEMGVGYWQEGGEAAAYEAWTDAGGDGEDFPGHCLDPKACCRLDEVAACVHALMQTNAEAGEVASPPKDPAPLAGVAEAELEVTRA